MENSTHLQKKDLVFRIIDEMKKNGEKINADIIAKKAQMGKQTILPFYNEWRFLEDPQQQENELPNDLVRSLQRLLIEWRHQLSVNLKEHEISAKHQAEQLNRRIEELEKQQNNLLKTLSAEKQVSEQLNNELHHNSHKLIEKDMKLQELQIKAANQEKELISIKRQQEDTKNANLALMEAQEKKLDQQHKVQIDHWMAVVDEERLQKQAMVKELKTLQNELLISEKEKGTLENQIEHKTQLHNEACRERSEARVQLSSRESSYIIISKLELLFDIEESEILSRVKKLQAREHSSVESLKALESMQINIEKLERNLEDERLKNASLEPLKLQLEKSKGYVLALEKTMSKTQGKDE